MSSTPPQTPISPSWISFSPDAPHTPSPRTPRPLIRTPTGRSYSRPKPPTYHLGVPSSLPKLGAPPKRRQERPKAEEGDLDFFAPTGEVALVDDSPKEMRAQVVPENRFSIFVPSSIDLSTSPTLSSPDSSSSSHTPSDRSHRAQSDSPPTSNVSTPTNKGTSFLSNTPSPQTDLEILHIRILPPRLLAAYPFALPAWCAGKDFAPDDPDANSWEDELYSSLSSPSKRRGPPSPMKSPRHPYYFSRHSPASSPHRSPIRSRRTSLVAPRRPSTAQSLSFPPLLPTRARSTTLGGVPLSPKSKKREEKRERRARDREAMKNGAGYDIEAIDAFFGVTPEAGKAARCGYSGVGVEGRKGWSGVAEFEPLLRDAEDVGRTSGEQRRSGERRPAPLDLSRARAQSVTISVDEEEERGVSPDPITREVRRQSEVGSRPVRKEGRRELKRKKSVGKKLKGLWSAFVEGGGGAMEKTGKAGERGSF